MNESSTSDQLPKNEQNIKLIKEALESNSILQQKVESIMVLLNTKLIECRSKLEQIKKKERSKIKTTGTPLSLSPYFKYIGNDFPPDNRDTIIMRNMNMINFYSCTFNRWTIKDKIDFLALIKTISRGMKYQTLLKLRSSKRKNKLDNTTADAMSRIDDYELAELALPIDEDYDWENVSRLLKHRHSPLEYAAMWKLYLHPSINKEDWDRKECLTLQKLALEHKEQDWEAIAKELNTNRSAYQCFIYYITNMKRSIEKWTSEEDKHLSQLVENYRVGDEIPWSQITQFMPGKTKYQMYNRWYQCLKPNIKKGKFLPEEDAVLLTCVKRFGMNFEKITKYINGRTVYQLRARFKILNTNHSAQWTEQEDKLLLQLIASQGQNIQYSTLVSYFKGKTRGSLRMRHKTLSKWMDRHPNLDLSFAPRRQTRLLNHGTPCATIDTALDGLNKKLSTIVACRETFDEDEYESKNIKKLKGDIALEQIIVDIMNLDISRKSVTNMDNHDRSLAYKPFFSYESKLFIDFWKYSKEIKTYSKVTPNKSEKQVIDTGIDYYIFPPTYQTLAVSRLLLQTFVSGNEPARLNSLQVMCEKNEAFKNTWSLILKTFRSVLVTPLLLSEIEKE